MRASAWETATIDIDRATEFTGDDVARFSSLVDLKNIYEFLTVIVPALDASAVITPYVQMDGDVDTVPVAVHALDDDATGSFAHATSSGAGSLVVTFRIGGVQHVRLYAGADQAADRTFYVRGFNRENL